MPYIKRDIEDKILSLSKEYACILITAPRQVGKTTVLRQLMDDQREYVTLDDTEARSLAKLDPSMFFQPHTTPIMIDEVQYASQAVCHQFRKLYRFCPFRLHTEYLN